MGNIQPHTCYSSLCGNGLEVTTIEIENESRNRVKENKKSTIEPKKTQNIFDISRCVCTNYQDDPVNCPALQRVSILLHDFKSVVASNCDIYKKTQQMVNTKTITGKYDNVALLNDYIHIQQNHNIYFGDLPKIVPFTIINYITNLNDNELEQVWESIDKLFENKIYFGAELKGLFIAFIDGYIRTKIPNYNSNINDEYATISSDVATDINRDFEALIKANYNEWPHIIYISKIDYKQKFKEYVIKLRNKKDPMVSRIITENRKKEQKEEKEESPQTQKKWEYVFNGDYDDDAIYIEETKEQKENEENEEEKYQDSKPKIMTKTQKHSKPHLFVNKIGKMRKIETFINIHCSMANCNEWSYHLADKSLKTTPTITQSTITYDIMAQIHTDFLHFFDIRTARFELDDKDTDQNKEHQAEVREIWNKKMGKSLNVERFIEKDTYFESKDDDVARDIFLDLTDQQLIPNPSQIYAFCVDEEYDTDALMCDLEDTPNESMIYQRFAGNTESLYQNIKYLVADMSRIPSYPQIYQQIYSVFINANQRGTTNYKKVKVTRDSDLYSFGKKYYYWDTMKRHPCYIKAKYKNLKEELLSECILDILNKQIGLCQTNMKTQKVRALRANTNGEYVYGIKLHQLINLQQMFAVRMYCDLSPVCERAMKALISNDKLQIAGQAHLVRLLTETVQCFGTPIRGFVYRGLKNPLKFPKMMAEFNLPTSTSTNVWTVSIFLYPD